MHMDIFRQRFLKNCLTQDFEILYKALISDKLYCVLKNQPHIAYQSLYLFTFLSLKQKFMSQISQLLLKPESSDFVYT